MAKDSRYRQQTKFGVIGGSQAVPLPCFKLNRIRESKEQSPIVRSSIGRFSVAPGKPKLPTRVTPHTFVKPSGRDIGYRKRTGKNCIAEPSTIPRTTLRKITPSKSDDVPRQGRSLHSLSNCEALCGSHRSETQLTPSWRPREHRLYRSHTLATDQEIPRVTLTGSQFNWRADFRGPNSAASCFGG